VSDATIKKSCLTPSPLADLEGLRHIMCMKILNTCFLAATLLTACGNAESSEQTKSPEVITTAKVEDALTPIQQRGAVGCLPQETIKIYARNKNVFHWAKKPRRPGCRSSLYETQNNTLIFCP